MKTSGKYFGLAVGP